VKVARTTSRKEKAVKLDDKLWQKYERLKKIIESLEGVVIGFSGGVDSTFLLKAAHDVPIPKERLKMLLN